MKISFEENDGCFAVHFEPESMQDQTKLVRMAINATKEVRVVDAYAYRDGTMAASIVIGKVRPSRETPSVRKGR